MECKIRDLIMHTELEEVYDTRLMVISYGDNNWALKLGDYGHNSYVLCNRQDMEDLVAAIQDLMKVYDEEEAWESGDFETKMDVLNTETWLEDR